MDLALYRAKIRRENADTYFIASARAGHARATDFYPESCRIEARRGIAEHGLSQAGDRSFKVSGTEIQFIAARGNAQRAFILT